MLHVRCGKSSSTERVLASKKKKINNENVYRTDFMVCALNSNDASGCSFFSSSRHIANLLHAYCHLLILTVYIHECAQAWSDDTKSRSTGGGGGELVFRQDNEPRCLMTKSPHSVSTPQHKLLLY